MPITSYYPVVLTRDVAGTVAFYRTHFAFRPLFEAHWYVHLQMDGHPDVNLAVLSFDHETIPEAGREPTRGLILNFEVDDVDERYAQASRSGLPILLPLRDEPFGQRHFITADPNGVLLDVIKPIPPSGEFAAQYSEEALPG